MVTMTSDLGQGSRDEPRVRIKIGVRELLLSLAVLGLGVFLMRGIVINPRGNALRRSGAGLAAVVIGLAGVGLSFGRGCSGCGSWMRRLSIRGSRASLAILAQALSDGGGPATEKALLGAADSGRSGDLGSLDIAYCQGCARLVRWRVQGQGRSASAGTRTVTGTVASELAPVLAAYRSQQERETAA